MACPVHRLNRLLNPPVPPQDATFEGANSRLNSLKISTTITPVSSSTCLTTYGSNPCSSITVSITCCITTITPNARVVSIFLPNAGRLWQPTTGINI
jgi:hypothetical protein